MRFRMVQAAATGRNELQPVAAGGGQARRQTQFTSSHSAQLAL
jgi:hypothetical protein